MQDISSVLKQRVKKVREETCECGNVYPIYKSKYGEYGECKPCRDQEIAPKKEDIIQRRVNKFAENFERLPKGISNATFDNYQPKNQTQIEAKQKAERYAEQFDLQSGSLVFSGTPGLGKSHLSYCIKNTVQDKGFSVLYIKSTDLLESIRNSYSNPTQNETKIYQLIEQVNLLILDDIGSEYVKQSDNESWASDVLYKVMDSRQEQCNVFSTNYNSTELEKKYGYPAGNRIVSRMLNNAQGIRLEGDDYRKGRKF